MSEEIYSAPLTKQSIFQQGNEKALFWATVLVCEYHMVLCTYRHIIWNNLLLQRIDKWLGVLLFLGFLGYLVVSFVFFPQTKNRLYAVIRKMRTYDYAFMFFLPFWYVFSCVLRQFTTGQPSIKDNNWWIYITALTSLVMFPMARFTGAERAKKIIHPMMKAIVLPNLVFTIWIIWKYVHLDFVTFPSGTSLGMMDDFSLIIGENRMHTGYRALTMLGLCLYFACEGGKYRKIPYLIGIVVYFSTIVMNNNRAAWYSALLLAVMAVFLFAWYLLERYNRVVRCLIGLTCSVACVICLNWYRGELFVVLDEATHFSEGNIAFSTMAADRTERVANQDLWQAVPLSASTELAAKPSDYARTIESGLDGRAKVYKASFFVMFSSPYNFFFGITHADVGDTFYGLYDIVKVYPSAHNFFLQMGVAFGVPMMLASVVFVVLLLIRCWRILFRHKEMFRGARMIPLVIIPLLAADMFDTTLTAGSTFPCAAFYLFAGWVVAMDLELKEQGGK